MAAFDFAAVETQTEELEHVQQEYTAANLEATGFPQKLRDSKADGLARRIVIPSDKVKTADGLIRRAALLIDSGAAVRVVDNGDGTSVVKYWAKDKRIVKPGAKRPGRKAVAKK